MASTPARKVRCREIASGDIEALVALLTRGFQGRPAEFWKQGLQRQAIRAVPDGYPRYGFMLEADGRAVGVILLLFAQKTLRGQSCVTCNVSSWYVDPEFRSQGALLTAMALKHKDVTYVNVTPARPTWPIVEAQGFKRYCCGLFFAAPVLSRAAPGMTLEVIQAHSDKPAGLDDTDFELLARHAGYGCVSLLCRTGSNVTPFVFAPFRARRGRLGIPAMQLAYCRDVSDFVACAGIIGRHLLLRHRKPIVIVDSNGPIRGLVGFYTEARGRKYFRGPNPPRLADLTETELVLYGL